MLRRRIHTPDSPSPTTGPKAKSWHETLIEEKGRHVGAQPSSHVPFAVCALTLGPIALHLWADSDKTTTVTLYRNVYVRQMELIYVTAILPTWLISLITLCAHILPPHSILNHMSWFFFAVFAYGHGVHWTANAVHTFYAEYNLSMGLREKVPEEIHRLVYFLDEDLGHWIMFGGLYLLWSALALATHYQQPSNLGRFGNMVCAVCGVVGGLAHAVAFIEATHPVYGMYLSTFLCLSACIGMILNERNGGNLAPKGDAGLRVHPFVMFALMQGIVLPVGVVGYRWLVGRWVQPSELGGYVCVLGNIGVVDRDVLEVIRAKLPPYCTYL
eukprot:comp12149_c0_seq1/m.6899 comp12149_c0_seq1/g.6899  ORF comp12149_c0_seq1/g.6899 comp12149_c0_seq1/m.6899 type:complete len:328 (-) comp12149_c0_seq1:207-1190(-)